MYEIEILHHFFFILNFLKFLQDRHCRSGSDYKDLKSDVGSTLSVNLWDIFIKNVTFKWQYSGFNFKSFI